mgnify:FL=1
MHRDRDDLIDRLDPGAIARFAAMSDLRLFWTAEALAHLAVPWHRLRLDLYEQIAALVIPVTHAPEALMRIEAGGDALETRYADAIAHAWAATAEQLRRIDPAHDPLAGSRLRT